MFSIMENIYSGWQYFINILSLVGGNFHIVLEYISKFSGYVSNLFENFPVPAWISLTFLATLGLFIASKLCHWG